MRNVVKEALTLPQFLQRKQVLESYKSFLKLLRHLEEKDRSYYKESIRDEYKRNKGTSDVKHLLNYANQQLRLLENNLIMSNRLK
jgi:hypothetical protein